MKLSPASCHLFVPPLVLTKLMSGFLTQLCIYIYICYVIPGSCHIPMFKCHHLSSTLEAQGFKCLQKGESRGAVSWDNPYRIKLVTRSRTTHSSGDQGSLKRISSLDSQGHPSISFWCDFTNQVHYQFHIGSGAGVLTTVESIDEVS